MWTSETVKIKELVSFLNGKKLKPGEWTMLVDRASSTTEVGVIYWSNS